MIVVWLPRAIEQLLSIIDYISKDNPGVPIELAQTIRERADTLSTYPNAIVPGASRARANLL
ncbi:hypothetical protein AWB67_06425 [Caballeronia terrestris]|uniref:Plasmid stabilization system protein n=1 Tax=Caballeronia terrestris TaxID=1226301 RepID=A0A158KQS3_9BURK|nr:type II toxin-antitoxin system RelE/ParE family toxin [Caballeronia terrestris]SAL83506.1 hypothetical protein AWB67_06425 [Caballeronia terrestris]